jgi:hypothetical protein
MASQAPAILAVGRSPADIQAEQQRIAALHEIRDRHVGNDGAVQCRRALDALQTLGHLIVTTWRHIPTESGQMHRIGKYTLLKGVT